MNPDSSPFTPGGAPVPVGSFFGREPDIRQLLASVIISVKTQTLKIDYAGGYRGVGKTSLVRFVQHLAEQQHDMVGAYVRAAGVREVGDMVRRTFDALLRDSTERPWYKPVRKFLGNAVERTGLLGISEKFNPSSGELAAMVNGFVQKTRELLGELRKASRSGLFLILDDADELMQSEQFLIWLKNIIDTVDADGKPFPLLVVMVGEGKWDQETVEGVWGEPQDWTSDPMYVAPWSSEEIEALYRDISARTGVKFKQKKECIECMAVFSAGLPAVAHEIGDAVWRAADGQHITLGDAYVGIQVGVKIAGERLIHPLLLGIFKNAKYNFIFRKIVKAEMHMGVIDCPKLQQGLSGKVRQEVDDFFKEMTEMGLFCVDPEAEGDGQYRFFCVLYILFCDALFTSLED